MLLEASLLQKTQYNLWSKKHAGFCAFQQFKDFIVFMSQTVHKLYMYVYK